MSVVASEDVLFKSASQELRTAFEKVQGERDEYKHLYVMMLETVRKLQAGLTGQKSERHIPSGEQLTLDVLNMLVAAAEDEEKKETPEKNKVAASERSKPTGRKPLPEKLPRVTIEVIPLEVQRAGLDAFNRIGEDVSEVVEKRPASTVVVRIIRAKFVAKAEGTEATKAVHQEAAVELPIPRGIAGPGMIADSIVKRWGDHSPLHRMERIYGREGYPVNRSTICGWHEAASVLVAPLLLAMWEDALANASYLCIDATGVLVQNLEKCRHAHFFVVVAPERHVLFGYSEKHNAKAVDKLLAGYKGYLVCDAHSVYNHLYVGGDVIECSCWAHARRYFFKALDSDAVRATHVLEIIRQLFALERDWASSIPAVRVRQRQLESKPLVEKLFNWLDVEALKVLDETPISKAIQYARNQRKSLMQFLESGVVPMDNNVSERELRREAMGRNNWTFVGSDDGGRVNACFVSLIASCQMHGIEPYAYLRDIFCLIPGWNQKKVLELSPMRWKETSARPEVVALLEANIFRQVALGIRLPDAEKPKK